MTFLDPPLDPLPRASLSPPSSLKQRLGKSQKASDAFRKGVGAFSPAKGKLTAGMFKGRPGAISPSRSPSMARRGSSLGGALSPPRDLSPRSPRPSAPSEEAAADAEGGGAAGGAAGGVASGGSKLHRWRKLLALTDVNQLYAQWQADPALWAVRRRGSNLLVPSDDF